MYRLHLSNTSKLQYYYTKIYQIIQLLNTHIMNTITYFVCNRFSIIFKNISWYTLPVKISMLIIVVVFVFNVPPTAKVIWRQGHGLVSSDRLVKPGIEPATPGLQGEWNIHYTTVAPLYVDYYCLVYICFQMFAIALFCISCSACIIISINTCAQKEV